MQNTSKHSNNLQRKLKLKVFTHAKLEGLMVRPIGLIERARKRKHLLRIEAWFC